MMICPVTGATQADFDFPLYEMDDVVLMQYTGLKDKNGVEIYEGDVVRYDCGHGHIEWESGGLIIKWFGGNQTPLSFTSWRGHGHLEIIGNIHQNPELIPDKV
jgi:hypothetical protein